MNNIIKILPLEQKHLLNKPLELNSDDNYKIENDDKVMFFQNAKSAIHALMKLYNIGIEDEIFISTTSNSNYVASCVTCTIFNYGKPSRVITNQTKMIYIINEFGFPNRQIHGLRKLARKMNIPVVEDTAHSISSNIKDNKLLVESDYFIASLPKFLPVSNGGILIGKNKVPSELKIDTDDKVERIFKRQMKQISGIRVERRKRFSVLKEILGNPIMDFDIDQENIDPFLFIFDHAESSNICERINENFPGVELFPLYVRNRIAIPINPYADLNSYKRLALFIRSVIDD